MAPIGVARPAPLLQVIPVTFLPGWLSRNQPTTAPARRYRATPLRRRQGSFATPGLFSIVAFATDYRARDFFARWVWFLHHAAKKESDMTNAQLRISDNVAFTVAPRHVYSVLDDPVNVLKLLIMQKTTSHRQIKKLWRTLLMRARSAGMHRQANRSGHRASHGNRSMWT
jgi:hypothetical protein